MWSTPAIDLFYLLHLVVAPEVKERRRSELIRFYYNELVKTLHKMGYLGVVPKLQDLQLELLHNGFLGKLFKLGTYVVLVNLSLHGKFTSITNYTDVLTHLCLILIII